MGFIYSDMMQSATYCLNKDNMKVLPGLTLGSSLLNVISNAVLHSSFEGTKNVLEIEKSKKLCFDLTIKDGFLHCAHNFLDVFVGLF